MNQQARDELIRAALDAQRRAYAPYSNFLVGAAIRAASGNIYQGCNVENASFSLTICAERVAASAAVAAGDRQIEAVAVATRGGVTPCGACRQFLVEFNPKMVVITVDSLNQSDIRETTLEQLLPSRFDHFDAGAPT
jgi:cytidine deaminase